MYSENGKLPSMIFPPKLCANGISSIKKKCNERHRAPEWENIAHPSYSKRSFS